MRNKPCYLGIDLGTSSVKLLLANSDGVIGRAKCSYDSPVITDWCDALKKAVARLDTTNICGICLSSQVGTYITDAGDVLGWDSPAGKEELRQIKTLISDAEWTRNIGMIHPDLISYPLPRLLYIKEHFPQCREVIMPKELLLRELTGSTVSDIFSWRGLCHPGKKAYAQALLDRFGIDVSLPPLALPTDLAGHITAEAAQKYALPQGVPVYVGCNDFFAGLLGMGIWEEGSVFELSGTSAHLGVITAASINGAFVSGPYFNGYATYGGTKSTGVSCDFAIKQFGIDGVSSDRAYDKPPVFLPYLKGERAPIYDENARGVFFGLTDRTTREDMAYAVLEGVVFSLYHIGEGLPMYSDTIITGGGSAVNTLMAQLKAALFDCNVLQVAENDASALGAAMIAMVGGGSFTSLPEAMKTVVSYRHAAGPDLKLRAMLLRRYELYKDLYQDLKHSFEHFSKEESI